MALSQCWQASCKNDQIAVERGEERNLCEEWNLETLYAGSKERVVMSLFFYLILGREKKDKGEQAQGKRCSLDLLEDTTDLSEKEQQRSPIWISNLPSSFFFAKG